MPSHRHFTDAELDAQVALYLSLPTVRSVNDAATLPPDAVGVNIERATDEVLAAIAARAPGIRILGSDGNSHVTDAGLVALTRFTALEELDLEYSAVTDAGLDMIAAVATLRWVDLGGCAHVTRAGRARLRGVRPDLEVEPESA